MGKDATSRNALAALLVTVHGREAYAVAAARLLDAINQGECDVALAWSGILKAAVRLSRRLPSS